MRCLTETPSLPRAGTSKAIDSEQWYTRTNPHLSLQVTECFREDCFGAEHSRRRKIKRKKYLKSCIYRWVFVCIYKLDIIVWVEQGTSSYELHLGWFPISPQVLDRYKHKHRAPLEERIPSQESENTHDIFPQNHAYHTLINN